MRCNYERLFGSQQEGSFRINTTHFYVALHPVCDAVVIKVET